MQYAFLDGSIDHGHSLRKERLSLFSVTLFDCGSQSLDLGAQRAAVAAIDFISPLGLSVALLR